MAPLLVPEADEAALQDKGIKNILIPKKYVADASVVGDKGNDDEKFVFISFKYKELLPLEAYK